MTQNTSIDSAHSNNIDAKEKAVSQKETIAMLEARIAELEMRIEELAKPRPKKSHKKLLVLELLTQQRMSTSELAEALCISKGNVGTLLTYLRQDGISVCRDENHKHFILG